MGHQIVMFKRFDSRRKHTVSGFIPVRARCSVALSRKSFNTIPPSRALPIPYCAKGGHLRGANQRCWVNIATDPNTVIPFDDNPARLHQRHDRILGARQIDREVAPEPDVRTQWKPQSRNLFEIIGRLQDRGGFQLKVQTVR